MTDKNGRRAPFFGVTFLRANKKGNEERWHVSHNQSVSFCYPTRPRTSPEQRPCVLSFCSSNGPLHPVNRHAHKHAREKTCATTVVPARAKLSAYGPWEREEQSLGTVACLSGPVNRGAEKEQGS